MGVEAIDFIIIIPATILTCLFLGYVYHKRGQMNTRKNHKAFALRIDQIVSIEHAHKQVVQANVSVRRDEGDFAPGDQVLTVEEDEEGRIPGIVKQQKGDIFQVEMSRGYPQRPRNQMFKAEQLELYTARPAPTDVPQKYTVEISSNGRESPSPYRMNPDSTEPATQEMTGFFNIGDRVSVYVENMQMWVDGVVFNRMKGIYSIEVDGKKIVVGRENLKQASSHSV